MKMILFLQYYTSKLHERQKEIDFCLIENIKLKEENGLFLLIAIRLSKLIFRIIKLNKILASY